MTNRMGYMLRIGLAEGAGMLHGTPCHESLVVCQSPGRREPCLLAPEVIAARALCDAVTLRSTATYPTPHTTGSLWYARPRRDNETKN